MKKKMLISFSGGKTSAFMTKWCLDNLADEYEMIVVFANTGKEREETLIFTDRCDKYFGFNCKWIEAVTNPENGKGVDVKIVDFITASRNGEPFEQMIAKHGIPSVANPVCTRELKTRALRAYCRAIGWKNYFTAIGIRVDEFDRISPTAEKDKYIYPLISNIPTTRNQVNKFWSEQSFNLELKSYEGNCDLCFKKSVRKLMTIVDENPNVSEWWRSMEEKYDQFIPEGRRHNPLIKLPIRFFRENRSVDDLIKLSKNDFEHAKDESIYYPEYVQGDLFGILLDVSNGCTESCEVF